MFNLMFHKYIFIFTGICFKFTQIPLNINQLVINFNLFIVYFIKNIFKKKGKKIGILLSNFYLLFNLINTTLKNL
jgi:hypothetical protein